MLRSAEFFREEIDEHIFHKRCPAKVCAGLIAYEVTENSPKLPEAAAICPTEAVLQEDGGSKHAATGGWHIDRARCIRCDACREVAPEAIAVVDAQPVEGAVVRVQDVGLDARGSMLH
jgi:Fe-S-cluster-containing hydrogenase component 2